MDKYGLSNNEKHGHSGDISIMMKADVENIAKQIAVNLLPIKLLRNVSMWKTLIV